MKINDLAQRESAWLQGETEDSDVVVGSRIRLSRNLEGYSFVNKASDQDLERLRERVAQTVAKQFRADETTWTTMENLDDSEATLLVERKLATHEFLESDRPRALFFDNGERFSVMVNEEDHLWLQGTGAGLELPTLWDRIDKLDDLFDGAFPYAFDEKYGYLTASPANVGTGMVASALLHLPALVETGEIARVLRALQKFDLEVRGLYHDVQEPVGQFFLIRTRTTLGKTEQAIMELLQKSVAGVVNYERKAREALLDANRVGIVDRCYRALGALRMARLASLEEATSHLSSLRLGARIGILNAESASFVDKLLLQVQPAHLRTLMQNDDEDEDSLRAMMLRKQAEKLVLDE